MGSAEAERRAAADLVRMAEPGDALLGALVRACGFEEAHGLALSREAGARRRAADAVVEALSETEDDAGPLRARVRAAHDRWRVRFRELDAERDLRVMAKLGGRLVLPSDPEWPGGVDDLGAQAPFALWARGPLPLAEALSRSIAVVGARAADSYGLTVTRQLAWDLAAAGHAVVSGGAYGVDATAHRTALAAGGVTAAFMAGGADSAYPRGNAELLGRIAERGVIVSESAPGQTAMRHRFLLRNRLIAAAARATLVTAAGHRSGALNTARRAAELLRPVGAVPGSVMAAHSAGCHRLIQEGAAVLVVRAEDALALAGSLGEAMEQAARGECGSRSEDEGGGASGAGSSDASDASGGQGELRLTDGLGPAELQIYSALPVRRGADVPTLAARAGLAMPQAMSALASLELSGHAEKTARGWSKRRG
ncbi:DNA-processing protein DprA [Brevibacterium album]|uniref:DNA-processing protein DprA n=1 Tax=Brevibacterium album TaxID=417948 RepID=UPI000555B4CB|nr:DNA-processing protein DprA [Brevibacterium album]